MKKDLLVIFIFLFSTVFTINAQTAGKKNSRPNKSAPQKAAEPFEKSTVEQMTGKCIQMETEAGNIELELFPQSAPETVRNFLNLVSLKAFDTTTFSRVVPGFVIQGGNPGSRQDIPDKLYNRMNRNIPDEPNEIKHKRGILSMARADEPNSASSNFFILVGNGGHLDGKFSAFGKVTNGMDVVDKIAKGDVIKDSPVKPVLLKKAVIIPCPEKKESE